MKLGFINNNEVLSVGTEVLGKSRAKKTTVELMKAIKEALDNQSYFFTAHAKVRSKQRKNVDEFQVVRILRSKSKYHEPKKDTYSDDFETWNYSIRGSTVDDEDVRVILSFDESNMLIITVINLDE